MWGLVSHLSHENKSRFAWLPVFKHLDASCLLSAGATGLYFPQNEYTETVYVGLPAGTPILQVHAMLDNDTERPHFYLCWIRRPPYSSWFHLDGNTGILSLNKTLEESDFALLCKFDTSFFFFMVMCRPSSVPGIFCT